MTKLLTGPGVSAVVVNGLLAVTEAACLTYAYDSTPETRAAAEREREWSAWKPCACGVKTQHPEGCRKCRRQRHDAPTCR